MRSAHRNTRRVLGVRFVLGRNARIPSGVRRSRRPDRGASQVDAVQRGDRAERNGAQGPSRALLQGLRCDRGAADARRRLCGGTRTGRRTRAARDEEPDPPAGQYRSRESGAYRASCGRAASGHRVRSQRRRLAEAQPGFARGRRASPASSPRVAGGAGSPLQSADLKTDRQQPPRRVGTARRPPARRAGNRQSRPVIALMRIGINGFGRIGRNFTKAIVERHPEIEIAAINDLTDAQQCAHLFKHDSNYGAYAGTVGAQDGRLRIDAREIRVFAERDPAKLQWRDLGVDVVVESTGLFTDAAKARAHIDSGGAKKVIISAPAKGEDITIVLGVNQDRYDPAKHHVISNASCTTNCLATAVKPVVDALGWVKGFMTTIHSYTNDQNVLDGPHKDPRRARNAATNIVPTSTVAAKALYLTIPEVEGTFDGFALRVPTPTVSMIYLVAQTRKPTTRAELNAILRNAAEGELSKYVAYTEDELVSSDFKQDPHSSIIDAKLNNANGDLVQIAAWYDNEWGYSCRLAELTAMVLTTIPANV